MPTRGKTFELLDFPKFSAPSLNSIDVPMTAELLRDRLAGPGGFMSYATIWPRMDAIVGGLASDAYIEREFKVYADSWKNDSIQDAVRLLRDHFGGRGRWYPFTLRPIYTLGFWFKPSIKGVWFVDGTAYAVMVNARKGQRLLAEHLAFFARGIYELHCVEDPNDPLPLIVDLSEPVIGQGRQLRVHAVPIEQAVSLNDFDNIVREFLRALRMAGVSVPPTADIAHIVPMFKRR